MISGSDKEAYMDTQDYSLESIHSMVFESDEPADFWENEQGESACMLTAADLAGMPEPEDKQITELRMLLSGLFEEKFGSSYAKLECECGISHSLFQKVLKHRNGRSITYNLLAKFCVGAKLTVEEADEMFMLMGHTLNGQKNRSDYILLCELRNGSDITEYDADLRKYGLQGVLSSAE